jgi:hypothetical protein
MATLVFTTLPEVNVDFNSTSGLGRFRTSDVMSPEAWPALAIGKWVLARDGEGNRCAAKVSAIHNTWAELQPEWPTWVSSDEQATVIWTDRPGTLQLNLDTPELNGYVDGLDHSRSRAWVPQAQEVLAAVG